jgi:DNA-binding Lrp family transcriptional regulator
MEWNDETESLALQHREAGKTYAEIATALGTSATSVKHKVRRLQQSSNMDRYKHTSEKTEQLEVAIAHLKHGKLNTLETHCGFGGMTERYQKLGKVDCFDIDEKRVAFVNGLLLEGVSAVKGDSEIEVFRLIANRQIYDIVDIDPYGLPSRYFPHAFYLLKKGIMFLTFPVMGVAQINKITIRHYQAFWDIELEDNEIYVDKIKSKLEDMAFQCKREIQFLDIRKIGRIYRMAIHVEKKSLCDIVGLVVNR